MKFITGEARFAVPTRFHSEVAHELANRGAEVIAVPVWGWPREVYSTLKSGMIMAQGRWFDGG